MFPFVSDFGFYFFFSQLVSGTKIIVKLPLRVTGDWFRLCGVRGGANFTIKFFCGLTTALGPDLTHLVGVCCCCESSW